MYQIKQSEATAARRRIPVLFVSSTDGFTPVTPTSPAAYISVNGGTFVASTNAVTLETLAAGQSASGCYYLELTAAEVATLGVINVNIQSTNARQFNAVIQVMAYDAYAVTNLGLSALPAVASGSAGAIPTTGSGANQIAVNGSGAISTVVSVTNGVTVTTNNDKTGYSLATAPPTAAAIATQVWSETLPGTYTATQAGNILNQGSATSIWAATTRTLTAGTNIVLAKGTGITGFNDIAATDVWAATTRTLSSGANIVLAKGTGITGFNDITSQSVWDVLAANVTTASSIGLQLKTNIDTTISSRMATFTYTTPPTAAAIATQVWSEALPGTYTSGQAGFKLNAAGTAADPWSTLLPGAYGAGTAGNIIGNRLDTNVGSRMATFTLPTRFSSLAIDTSGFVTFNNVISIPTAGSISTAVWTEPIPGSFAAGSAGAKLNSAASAGDPWSTVLPGTYAAGTAGNIVGNRLDTNVGSRMATFTLPTNFSTLAISGTGAVTAGTVSDKTGYSLSAAQTFNTTGSVGSVSGSVASVTGNVGGNVVGSVNNVVGNVGGNVVGSVGSVSGSVGSVADASTIWNHLVANINTTNSIGLQLKTNVDATISSRLASSSYTAPPTVTQIWQQALPSTFTTGQAGYILGTNLNDTITSRMASFTYTTPPTTTAITQAIWNQVRSTASPTGGVPAANTFGYYLDSRVSTAGGGGGGVIVKQGPFKLSTTDLGPNNILDLVKGDNRNIQMSVVDEYGENIPLNAVYTHSVKVYNSASVLVQTYAATLDYATGGLVSFNIDTTVTNTTGNYNAVLVINDGTSDTIYGGLEIQVRL
jgi:hypothetical protein